ncbi:MAG TPA: Gfo/Idh/MocA family oxidoreductase [Phycisphaerae bacterium]|nr:Gfo/Idh/MocA family oxidoreductase [Phycisphaerae bacterium]
MIRSRQMNRRSFLKAAATVAAAPYVLTSDALGAPGRAPASERIAMGFIGQGGQGGGHLGISGRGDIQTLAVCDVDANRRYAAQQRVEKMYAQRTASGQYTGCAAYDDFRDLVARDDIDAVLIATPDHWHALTSIAALKAGKDVYCEKPHSLTIGEGRAVCQAAERYGRVFQTGSQERSGRGRLGCELVLNGRIGKVHTIRTYLPCQGRLPEGYVPEPPCPAYGYPAEKVPPEFDYDRWLGPAPWTPYNSRRCHFNFRWVLDYSDGELTDRGAHVNDLAMWGNGTDRTGPVEIDAVGQFQKGIHNVPVRYRMEYKFANGVTMITTSYNGQEDNPDLGGRGIQFEGPDGWLWIEIHGGALKASNPDILKSPIRPEEIHLHRSPGHHEDWLRAIRTRGETVAPCEAGHRTSSLLHLGLISMILGRKLRWDPDREEFPNDPEATRMVLRPMRTPWHI